ncbi:MAG: Tim44/TimA family putative adaptor protein [Rhodospirillales bacterium]
MSYDIILIALVAVFLVLQLRRVLGRRTGTERERPNPFAPPPRDDSVATGGAKVIDLPVRDVPAAIDLPRGVEVVKKGGGADAGLAAIKAADAGFDARGFIAGARGAFEMIVNAFAAGDIKTLRPLLAGDVYERFASDIVRRNQAKENLSTNLVGFDTSEIVAAEMRGRQARVTARFVSEQINVTRDAEGLIVDGNPNEVTKITDLWTFARDTSANDPNWLLVATEEPAEA